MQVDPIIPTLKAPGIKLLKLSYELLSSSALNLKLRRYIEVGFNLIQLRVKAGRSSVVYEVLVFRQKGAQEEIDDFVCDGIYENGVQDLITHQIRGVGIQYALLADDSTDYYNLWVNELREVIACNAKLYLQNPAYTVADVQAGAYTRYFSAQLEPCLTHKDTLHTVHTP